MYLEAFKLTGLPFQPSPDPQFFYLSRPHARARACLQGVVELPDGFAVVTGDSGSGKTALIEAFLAGLTADAVVAQVKAAAEASVSSFLRAMLRQLGFSPPRMQKAQALATLDHFLIEQHAAGRKVLLIVDAAHNLSLRTLEEIRLLSGVESTREKVLRVVLAGEPALNGKLRARELVQLDQRIRMRAALLPLTSAEVHGYIEHRLQVAGAQARIFDEDTFEEIHRLTGGMPRRINTLCDAALTQAFTAGRGSVTRVDVRTAAAGGPPRPVDPPGLVGPPGLGKKDAPVVGRVRVALDGQVVREIDVRVGRIVIGRTADNDLQLDSRFVSRHHCQIIADPSACLIEDLNSTNGTFVRARRVRRHPLTDGDIVSVGTHELTFQEIGGRRGRDPRSRATSPV